ncbi:hypothetical protein LTR53_018982, partial [Teratosphaeriaceae sp. CCFEE 6253]
MDPTPPRPAFRELGLPLVLGDGTVLRPKSYKASSPAEGGKSEEPDDDDAEEEFYDAVETQDAYELDAKSKAVSGSSSAAVSYPTLPPLDECVEDVSAASAEDPSGTSIATQAPSSTARVEAPTISHEMQLANAWLDAYKASLPPAKSPAAKDYQLRIYHFWHHQGLD